MRKHVDTVRCEMCGITFHADEDGILSKAELTHWDFHGWNSLRNVESLSYWVPA